MQSLVSLRIVLKNGEKSKVSWVLRIRKLNIQAYCILELCKDGQHSSRFLSASEISVNILLHLASTPSSHIDAQGFCWLMDVMVWSSRWEPSPHGVPGGCDLCAAPGSQK